MKQKRTITNPETGKENPFIMDQKGKSSRYHTQQLLKLRQVNDGSTKERAIKGQQILDILKAERSQKGLNTVSYPLAEVLNHPLVPVEANMVPMGD